MDERLRGLLDDYLSALAWYESCSSGIQQGRVIEFYDSVARLNTSERAVGTYLEHALDAQFPVTLIAEVDGKQACFSVLRTGMRPGSPLVLYTIHFNRGSLIIEQKEIHDEQEQVQ